MYIRLHNTAEVFKACFLKVSQGGLVHYLRFVKLCKSHSRHLFHPIFLILFTVVIFPEFVIL